MKIVEAILKIISVIAVSLFLTAILGYFNIVNVNITFLVIMIFFVSSISITYHYIRRIKVNYLNKSKVSELMKCIILIFLLFVICNLIIMIFTKYHGTIINWFIDNEFGFIKKIKEIFI